MLPHGRFRTIHVALLWQLRADDDEDAERERTVENGSVAVVTPLNVDFGGSAIGTPTGRATLSWHPLVSTSHNAIPLINSSEDLDLIYQDSTSARPLLQTLFFRS